MWFQATICFLYKRIEPPESIIFPPFVAADFLPRTNGIDHLSFVFLLPHRRIVSFFLHLLGGFSASASPQPPIMEKETVKRISRRRMKIRLCELCGEEEARVFCCSDSAYLCEKCDEYVHSANFIVARHLRIVLCSRCRKRRSDCAVITGARSVSLRDLCLFCFACRTDMCGSSCQTASALAGKNARIPRNAEETDSGLAGVRSNGRIVRKAEQAASGSVGVTKNGRTVKKAETVMKRWHLWLGLKNPSTVSVSVKIFRKCFGRGRFLLGRRKELRVWMSGCFLLGVMVCEEGERIPALCMFQRCCRVPLALLFKAAHIFSQFLLSKGSVKKCYNL